MQTAPLCVGLLPRWPPHQVDRSHTPMSSSSTGRARRRRLSSLFPASPLSPHAAPLATAHAPPFRASVAFSGFFSHGAKPASHRASVRFNTTHFAIQDPMHSAVLYPVSSNATGNRCGVLLVLLRKGHSSHQRKSRPPCPLSPSKSWMNAGTRVKNFLTSSPHNRSKPEILNLP